MESFKTFEKIELAGTCGMRILYCQECHVVELEIGALSLRLAPDIVRRFANVLMKASLKLEKLESTGLYEPESLGVMH